VAYFLDDRTAALSMIGYCHDTVVCLSVCPSVSDEVYRDAEGRCKGLKVVPRRVPSRALPIHIFRQFCSTMYRLAIKDSEYSALRKK